MRLRVGEINYAFILPSHNVVTNDPELLLRPKYISDPPAPLSDFSLATHEPPIPFGALQQQFHFRATTAAIDKICILDRKDLNSSGKSNYEKCSKSQKARLEF